MRERGYLATRAAALGDVLYRRSNLDEAAAFAQLSPQSTGRRRLPTQADGGRSRPGC